MPTTTKSGNFLSTSSVHIKVNEKGLGKGGSGNLYGLVSTQRTSSLYGEKVEVN